jgi:hypothetical protein
MITAAPNPTIDRTRSGGLRPPMRAGHGERWASSTEAPLYFRCSHSWLEARHETNRRLSEGP